MRPATIRRSRSAGSGPRSASCSNASPEPSARSFELETESCSVHPGHPPPHGQLPGGASRAASRSAARRIMGALSSARRCPPVLCRPMAAGSGPALIASACVIGALSLCDADAESLALGNEQVGPSLPPRRGAGRCPAGARWRRRSGGGGLAGASAWLGLLWRLLLQHHLQVLDGAGDGANWGRLLV